MDAEMAVVRDKRSRILAANPALIEMETRSHLNTFNEYNEDIFASMKESERRYSPSLRSFGSQQELSSDLRLMLVDFLVDKCHRLALSQTTLYLAVSLFDRYCSTRQLKKAHVQLLGLTCLWVSSKYNDNKYKILQLADLVRLSNNQFNSKLFKEMESHVLANLNWSISGPTLDTFIDYYLNKSFFRNYNNNSSLNNSIEDHHSETYYFSYLKIGANFLCELSLMFSIISLSNKPSKVAFVALLIMNNCYNLENFNRLILPADDSNKDLFRLLLDCFSCRFPNSFHSKYFSYKPSKKKLRNPYGTGKTTLSVTLIYSSLISYIKALNTEAKRALGLSSPKKATAAAAAAAAVPPLLPTLFKREVSASPPAPFQFGNPAVSPGTTSSPGLTFSVSIISPAKEPSPSKLASRAAPFSLQQQQQQQQQQRNFSNNLRNNSITMLNESNDKCNSLTSNSTLYSSYSSIFSSISSKSSSSNVNSPLSSISSPSVQASANTNLTTGNSYQPPSSHLSLSLSLPLHQRTHLHLLYPPQPFLHYDYPSIAEEPAHSKPLVSRSMSTSSKPMSYYQQQRMFSYNDPGTSLVPYQLACGASLGNNVYSSQYSNNNNNSSNPLLRRLSLALNSGLKANQASYLTFNSSAPSYNDPSAPTLSFVANNNYQQFTNLPILPPINYNSTIDPDPLTRSSSIPFFGTYANSNNPQNGSNNNSYRNDSNNNNYRNGSNSLRNNISLPPLSDYQQHQPQAPFPGKEKKSMPFVTSKSSSSSLSTVYNNCSDSRSDLGSFTGGGGSDLGSTSSSARTIHCAPSLHSMRLSLHCSPSLSNKKSFDEMALSYGNSGYADLHYSKSKKIKTASTVKFPSSASSSTTSALAASTSTATSSSTHTHSHHGGMLRLM